MTDLDVIEKLQTIVNCGTITTNSRRKGKAHWKDVYKWQTHRQEDTLSILLVILPYLCKRRKEKAAEIIEYLNGPGKYVAYGRGRKI